MAKYELKTKVNDADVMQFLRSIEDETKRNDSLELIDLMQEVTGKPPKMWGGAIIGFGSYHYKYESGHEGDMCILGFSPRKAALTLYIAPYYTQHTEAFNTLGKFKTGKGCVYIKKLEDVDRKVLKTILKGSWKFLVQLRSEGKI